MEIKKPIISATNLKVIYDKGTPAETVALSGATIEIFPEEYIIFFGPSGCGKSSLLYVIAGIESEFEGDAVVTGSSLHKMDSGELAYFHRTSIGMVFQAFNLIPTLNVLDNVILPQMFHGIGVKERYEKGRELLKRFGIADLEHRLPTELSGGQQQRVAIARSLINDPPIILADEPVGNLDSKSAETVMETFSSLNLYDKKTVILVTHDPSYLKYADRIFWMKDGKILKVEDNREKKEKAPDVPSENTPKT